MKTRILVTGAAGKTGGPVVAQLLEQGFAVRALVRSRDARSTRLAQQGAEVVVADLFDPAQLAASMQGVQRAYYCPPIDPFMIQGAVAFAIAAREARLEQVVMLGQWLSCAAHPSMMTRQTWLAEHLYSLLPDLAFTVVNPGFFADNYLRLIPFAAHLGIFPDLFEGTKNAPPSNEDIARVVVAVLQHPASHAGKRYRPTGPQLLSVSDMAIVLARVLDRRVRTVPMPFWLFTRAARMQGVDAFGVDVFRAYIEDHKQGAFAFGAPSDDILRVTGRAAESFETTARRYAASPVARRSTAATLKTLLDFVRTPIMPGYDVARYERAMGFPVPPRPTFAMQDARWKAEHAAQNATIAAPRSPAGSAAEPLLTRRAALR